MILTWFLAVIIIVAAIFNLFTVNIPSITTWYKFNKLPGVYGLPVIGIVHIVMTISSSQIMDIMDKYLRIYPRLLAVNVGGVLSVAVQDPDDLQVVLSSTAHIHKGIEYNLIMPWLNEGLLTSYGNKWHVRRKLLTPTFHFRILEDSMQGINRSTSILIEKLVETKGKIVSVEHYITRCALDIIGDTAMGINLEAQSESGRSYLESVKSTGESIVLRILSIWQYKDFLFNVSNNGRRFFKNLSVLHNFTTKTIRERKQTYSENKLLTIDDDTERKPRKPFLDCLLDTQQSSPETLTDLDIREEVDTFMFEGHDTTSSAISFAIWLLGTFPEEQEKAYEELKEIFGDEDRDMTIADTHKMVHMEKIIKETLRLYPSVPYFSRLLTEDCVLNDGTVIPAHVNATVIPYFIHRNAKYFPDPEKFDPERFSEENSVGRHPYSYIPFSAGPRNCIGQKFAMLEMKVTLAKIIRKLQITSVTRRDEFKLLPYLILRPTVPLKVKFTPRNVLSH